jgi:hypothetical protein
MNVWHPSHQPAQLPALPPVTDKKAGNRALEAIKSQIRQPVRAAERQPVFFSWSNTPESFRRLVARAALLPSEVCDKHDRDLTELEKAAIREAARRLRERADQLFAI